MGRCGDTAIKNLVALSVLNLHELLSLLFSHMDALRFGCFHLSYLSGLTLRVHLLLFLDIAIRATGFNRSDFGCKLRGSLATGLVGLDYRPACLVRLQNTAHYCLTYNLLIILLVLL